MSYKVYFYFYKNIFWINFAISGAFAALGAVQTAHFLSAFLSTFFLLFATAGYAMTLLIFHFFGTRTKYLYFNKGISLFRLYLSGFLINIVFVLFLYLLEKIIWLL